MCVSISDTSLQTVYMSPILNGSSANGNSVNESLTNESLLNEVIQCFQQDSVVLQTAETVVMALDSQMV